MDESWRCLSVRTGVSGESLAELHHGSAEVSSSGSLLLLLCVFLGRIQQVLRWRIDQFSSLPCLHAQYTELLYYRWENGRGHTWTRKERRKKREKTNGRRAVNAKNLKSWNSARGEWAWGVGKGWQHWSAIVFLRRSHPWFHLSTCQSASTSRFLSFQLVVEHWWLIGSWWIILGGGICRWLVGFQEIERLRFVLCLCISVFWG